MVESWSPPVFSNVKQFCHTGTCFADCPEALCLQTWSAQKSHTHFCLASCPLMEVTLKKCLGRAEKGPIKMSARLRATLLTLHPLPSQHTAPLAWSEPGQVSCTHARLPPGRVHRFSPCLRRPCLQQWEWALRVSCQRQLPSIGSSRMV